MDGPNTAGMCCGKAWVIGHPRCPNCPFTVPLQTWTAPNMGWQCPKCGRGNAPFVHQCPCGPSYVSWSAASAVAPENPEWKKQVEKWKADNCCPRCGAGPMPIIESEVLGDCALADCPIDPLTGMLGKPA